MIDRRDFCRTALAGMTAFGFSMPASRSAAESPDRLTDGFQSLPDDGLAREPLRLVSGRLPDGVHGTYFLNTPGKFQRGGERYTHWFDPDGFVQAFRLGPQGATHEGRFVETDKLVAERDAGRFLYPAFGTLPETVRSISGPDDMNAANISVLPVGAQIWALWEGGQPTALDPTNLSTVGLRPVADGFKHVPFSAHPRVDSAGSIWGFGNAALSGTLVIYQLNAMGDLERYKAIQGMPRSMVHDFTTTDRHLIVGFAPFLATEPARTYLEAFRWYPDRPRTYIVFDKEDFSELGRYELPAGFVFHHFGATAERDGTIRFAACTYNNTTFVESEARQILEGIPPAEANQARYEEIILRPNGTAERTLTDQEAEFPVMLPPTSIAASVCTGRVPGAALSNTLVARDGLGDVIGSFGDNGSVHIGEHVPLTGTDERVWIIGTSFDARNGETQLRLFNPAHLDDGPVAAWALPAKVPIPLHGAWLPS